MFLGMPEQVLDYASTNQVGVCLCACVWESGSFLLITNRTLRFPQLNYL